MVDSPCAPTAGHGLDASRRADGQATVGSAAPRRRALRRSRGAETTKGPQRWCGEIVSYGSGTETRYGVGGELGQTSGADAVRPPELEKKYVVATPTPVEDDLTGGRPARPRSSTAPRAAMPEVDLAPRVRVEVEPRSGLADRERVGARRDRLRLQRLGEPVLRHLRGDDAVEVGLETDAELTARSVPSATRRETGRGTDDRRGEAGSSRAGTSAAPAARCGSWTSVVFRRRPGPNVCAPAARCQSWPMPSRTVNGAVERDAQLRASCAREDADARDRAPGRAWCRGSSARGSRRTSSLLREAERAPLGHPDPVAPAAAADDEDRRTGHRALGHAPAVLEGPPERSRGRAAGRVRRGAWNEPCR